MSGILSLVSYLRDNCAEDVVSSASTYLSREADWAVLTLEAIDTLSDRDFFANAARVLVPNVQPRVFPIYVDEIGFSVVVNHYNRSDYERSFDAGFITPHMHHFSFVSRVLFGKFCEYRFDNSGSKLNPSLKPAAAVWRRAGDVYTLGFDTYHCIVAPEHNTTTLLVRSAPVFVNPHINADGYTMRDSLRERGELLRSLERAVDQAQSCVKSARGDQA